jgi:hypothetical protein
LVTEIAEGNIIDSNEVSNVVNGILSVSVALPTTLLKQQTSLETLSKIATKAFTSTALQVAL